MSRKQRGFTLVELLVVISIIGMLAALLLPAIQSARESGRRTTCLNNMRNIGMALYRYDESHGKLPGWRGIMVGDPKLNQVATVTVPHSWVFAILPDLEQSQLATDKSDKCDTTQFPNYFQNLGYRTAADPRIDMPHLNILVCPSDTRENQKSSPLNYTTRPTMSYVVNSGMPDEPLARTQSNATTLPDKPSNGVFQDGLPYVLNSSGQPQLQVSIATQTISTIQSGDGTSNTIMASENVDAGFYPDEEEWNVGFVWVPSTAENLRLPFNSATLNIRPINKETGQVDAPPLAPATGNMASDRARLAFARPSSNHPGGVNMVFCDGHTKFVADTVDYVVYGLLMSPKGRLTEDMRDNPPTPVKTLPSPGDGDFAIRNVDEAEY